MPPAATLLASVALVCEAGKLPYAVLFIFDNRPPSFFRLDSDELKIKALDVMKLGNQRISLIVDCDIQPDTAI